MKLDHFPKPYTQINSKGIILLNASTKTIKLLEEDIGVHLHDFGLGSGFLDITLKVETTK